MVVACPNFRIQVNLSAQPIQVGFDHIHADASAGEIGDLLGHGKPRQKNQLYLLTFRKFPRLFQGD